MLYTTHYMEEAERLCDRVGIVTSHLIAEGPPRALTARARRGEHIIMPSRATPGGSPRPRGASQGGCDGEAGCWTSSADAESALPPVMAAAMSAGAPIRSVTAQEPDLEAVFLHLTGKRLRD